jgi:hypothetical protein
LYGPKILTGSDRRIAQRLIAPVIGSGDFGRILAGMYEIDALCSVMESSATFLARNLEERIQVCTNRRVRNLAIEFRSGRIVLLGHTSTYHVKQLALHGLLATLPAPWPIENAITVG